MWQVRVGLTLDECDQVPAVHSTPITQNTDDACCDGIQGEQHKSRIDLHTDSQSPPVLAFSI